MPINSTLKNQVTSSKRVFGLKIEEVMGKDGELGLPCVIADCIDYIRQNDSTYLAPMSVSRYHQENV